MEQHTDKELKNMDLETAVADIGNAVYMACSLYERLEGKRKIHGNGHHMRQKVAEFAKNLMEERWIG